MEKYPEMLAQAAIHGGLVLSHAALISSSLQPGELICPFAIVTQGENRELVDFEADSQADAIAAGKNSLSHYSEFVDSWAFAREGLFSRAGSEIKLDVIIVSAWVPGLADLLTIIQGFVPASDGEFGLVGGISVSYGQEDIVGAEYTSLTEKILVGIHTHPNSVPWDKWLKRDA